MAIPCSFIFQGHIPVLALWYNRPVMPTVFSRLRLWLIRWWFYPALLATFLLGWYCPALGQMVKTAKVTPWLVTTAFLINGISLTTGALLGNLRRWRLMLVALLLIFVIAPTLVYLVRLVAPGGQQPLAVGFQLLAAMPPTLVSAVALTRVAMGNGAIALYITLFANALSIVLLPVVLWLTLGRQDIAMNMAQTSTSLAITVLLPTIAGQLARLRCHTWIDHHAKVLAAISQVIILAFFFVAIPDLPRDGVTQGMLWLVLLLAGLMHFVLLFVGGFAGRVLQEDGYTRRALTLCAAQKTIVLSVYLWERLLAPLEPAYGIAVLPAVVFYVVALIADSILAQWWAHRHLHAPEPPVCT